MELALSVPGRRYKLDVTIIPTEGNRLRFKYPFSKEMNAEVKVMQGAKYHGFDDPEKKYWTVENCPRNWFTLRYMSGHNVYERYDKPVAALNKDLYPNAYPHQPTGAGEILVRGRIILAWEMGTCKTYTSIMAMEQSGHHDWWWVGTKASLREMTREFKKWNSKVTPLFYTYDELKKITENWPKGKKAPRGLILDEASKVKTWSTQRTQAVNHVSTAIEKDWGDAGSVVLLTGTPAPKDPTDWWSLCEICKPGFLREGSSAALKKRLALTITAQGARGAYPQHITWFDDENKCQICGQYEKLKLDKKTPHDNHNAQSALIGGNTDYHVYQKSKNEVKLLYERMKGLVSIKFKKEVLSFLPDKIYHTEYLKPDESLLRTAKLIFRTAPNTITALTSLRELSDGFQYADEPCGKDTCPTCNGTGKNTQYYRADDPDGQTFDKPIDDIDNIASRIITCVNCKGTAQVTKYNRVAKEVPCLKDGYFSELLELHEDASRFVCYAGFTASIDRCVRVAHQNGWGTIRIDSRGWHATDYNNQTINVHELFDITNGDPFLQLFQDGIKDYPRFVIVAHAKSGGMALNLTKSPGIYYWSLTFDGEDYWQSQDRGHRPGMDLNRGLTIYHNVLLPTDQMVINNLKAKKDLQNMSMGVFAEALESTGERVI